ncbi:MAG TPA: TolC family protein [Bacteroidales bacterium]|nr:TolC family protein [Bacteroidales bacterium]
MRTAILILMGIFTLSTGHTQDQEQTSGFSINQAVEYAVANNLNAQNARLDVTSAQKRIWETAATGLPQVNASANYNNNLSLATTLIPDFFNDPTQKIEVQFGTKHYAAAGVSASQLIFSGEYFIGLQTAKLYREFSMKNQKLTEQQVKESVIQGYYLVLLARNSLRAIKGNLQNMKATYNETNELYKAGFVEENEVDQIKITLIDLENAVSSMKRQHVAAKSLLKYQMGVNLEEKIMLTDSLPDLVSALEYQALISRELKISQNINYRILSDQEKLAQMDMKAKRAEFLPSLSAFFSLDYTAQRDEFSLFDTDEDWFEASAIGVSFNMPIFSSGQRAAGLAQKKIEHQKAVNNKEFAAEGLKVDFMQAKYDLANAFEQYNREKKNMALAEKIITNTQYKYNEGVASSLELTQVNDQYLQTLNNYYTAMVDLLNSKLKLDVLMNKL